jgi:hypothetical protein
MSVVHAPKISIEGTQHPAVVMEVSGGGMLLALGDAERDAAARGFAQGDEVELRWGSNDLDLLVEAEVRHVRRQGDQMHISVRFTSMSEPAWLAIDAMLQNYERFEPGTQVVNLIGLSRGPWEI